MSKINKKLEKKDEVFVVLVSAEKNCLFKNMGIKINRAIFV